MPKHRNLTHVNKIGAVYGGLCINIKVETPASFILFYASLSYTVSILLMYEIHPYTGTTGQHNFEFNLA